MNRDAVVRLRSNIVDTVLKIKYYIYDVFDDLTVTDFHTEAEAAFEEGKIVYEVHETTWNTQWVCGKNTVQYEWY